MKALAWIVGLVVLVCTGIVIYLVTNSGQLLERAIETYGGRYLGAPVEVSGLDVSLAEGAVSIDGLEVGNPPGFSGPPAFRLANISVALNADQTSAELIVLKRVSIDGAEVSAQVVGRESNLQKLMDNVERQIGEPGPEEDAAEGEVKLIIDDFSFTGAKVQADSDLLGSAAVSIADVHLSGVGRQSNGATVGEVLAQVLKPVYKSVTRELVARGVDLEGARDKVEQRLRDQAERKLGSGLDALRDAIDKGKRP